MSRTITSLPRCTLAAPARRRALVRAAAITALLACGAAQAADVWPSRPIQMVVPFPAGSATDVMGRLFAKARGDRLGQTVVVDNRAGAGTVIGAAYAAKAPADGTPT